MASPTINRHGAPGRRSRTARTPPTYGAQRPSNRSRDLARPHDHDGAAGGVGGGQLVQAGAHERAQVPGQAGVRPGVALDGLGQGDPMRRQGTGRSRAALYRVIEAWRSYSGPSWTRSSRSGSLSSDSRGAHRHRQRRGRLAHHLQGPLGTGGGGAPQPERARHTGTRPRRSPNTVGTRARGCPGRPPSRGRAQVSFEAVLDALRAGAAAAAHRLEPWRARGQGRPGLQSRDTAAYSRAASSQRNRTWSSSTLGAAQVLEQCAHQRRPRLADPLVVHTHHREQIEQVGAQPGPRRSSRGRGR